MNFSVARQTSFFFEPLTLFAFWGGRARNSDVNSSERTSCSFCIFIRGLNIILCGNCYENAK